MRARMGALARWAKEDPKPHTKMMSDKFQERFERQVDPEGILPEPERIRRAEAARSFYYKQLAYKSSRARSKA